MILMDTPPVTPTSLVGNTMSLALLPPTPMAYSQTITATLPPTPPCAKRPKLSLNTSNVHSTTFGKSSTSLRLETLSATSPTVRNTFRNAYSPNLASKTTLEHKPKLPPLSTSLSPPITRQPTPLNTKSSNNLRSEGSPSCSASATSVSTIESPFASIPYTIPYNTCSILKKGPLPRDTYRRVSVVQHKPMFPASKTVSFRAPLTEDIRTTKYTMKHSDIDSSTSTISTLELSPPEDKVHAEESKKIEQIKIEGKPEEDRSALSPQTGNKRESSDEEDSDTCPATPIAGRRKRHRDWRWTLETLDQQTPSEDVDCTREAPQPIKNEHCDGAS